MRTEKCVPHGIVGWVLLEWTGADGMGALLCARQPRDEPAAGTVRDHEDSFSDEVVPEMGLEGWILERQDRSTLLVKAVAGARYRALWVAGFGDKSCPSVLCHRKEEDNGEQQPEATEGQVTGRESQEELSPPLPLPYLGFSLTGEGDKTGRVISGLLTTTSDTHSEGTLVGHTNSKIHWKAASNKLAPFTNPVLL